MSNPCPATTDGIHNTMPDGSCSACGHSCTFIYTGKCYACGRQGTPEELAAQDDALRPRNYLDLLTSQHDNPACPPHSYVSCSIEGFHEQILYCQFCANVIPLTVGSRAHLHKIHLPDHNCPHNNVAQDGVCLDCNRRPTPCKS